MKILTIFGTRPEAIKLAPVIHLLTKTPQVTQHVCVTAQHRYMLDQVLNIFDIKPDIDLDIMQPEQTLSQLTANLLLQLEPVIQEIQPNWILVQGDTISCFAGTLAGFYQQIPVAHIEAGLRTYDLFAPWPEEAKRRLTAILASCHFAPTLRAAQNLLQEGIAAKDIYITGNTIVDALLLVKDKLKENQLVASICRNHFPFLHPDKKLILITGHRRESFGNKFESICDAISFLAKKRPDIQIVFPVHLNPNVKEPVFRILQDHDNIFLLEPLDYLNFVALLHHTHLIITDSGGIQEEAPSFRIPVLVTRECTERMEAIDVGTAKLVGHDTHKIIATVEELLDNPKTYEAMQSSINPFGDGSAAKQIVSYLLEHSNLRSIPPEDILNFGEKMHELELD